MSYIGCYEALMNSVQLGRKGCVCRGVSSCMSPHGVLVVQEINRSIVEAYARRQTVSVTFAQRQSYELGLSTVTRRAVEFCLCE